MTINYQPCPRCRIPRTVRTHGRFLCFNCRYQWTSLPSVALMTPGSLAYRFSFAELERLLVYRGAVRAGVYSDWPVYA
jgi:hypothetical protein